MLLLVIYILPWLLRTALAATSAEWRSRSIYQILTDRFARTDNSITASCEPGFEGFCGGTWAGITQHLDYIQGMGFDAIWISPVVEQVANPQRAYHGYSARNLYSLNTHFGTADDLQALSAALHARNMYLMVDVAPNHMAYDGQAHTTDYTTLTPFSNATFFHPICFITDWTNVTQIQQCWLSDEAHPLPDLNTTAPAVRALYAAWIANLTTTYALDGIRIDTAQNIEPAFFPGFVDAAGVFALAEVASYYTQYACNYQAVVPGILGYPAYYTSVWFFNSTRAASTNLILDLYNTSALCTDTSLVANFMENHDKPRFASYTADLALAQNNLAYVFLRDGIPVLYQGQEQRFAGGADPWNREAVWLSGYNATGEMYAYIALLNKVRKLAATKAVDYLTSKAAVVYYDTHSVGFAKGSGEAEVLVVVNNNGAKARSYDVRVQQSGFKAGTTLIEVVGCKGVTAGSGGRVTIRVTGGNPVIMVAEALIKGSGVCGR